MIDKNPLTWLPMFDPADDMRVIWEALESKHFNESEWDDICCAMDNVKNALNIKEDL